MQRLYEVYDDVERPHEQFALVLMDEIDAHMHPEWQQRLVPALAELFPHIQFLATTHSPLIVGGMDVKQVTRFQRDADGKVRRIELDPDTTMGRTDQVLTGELFGLETTLDSATQGAVARYQEILALPSRSVEQDDELRRLEETLAFRIPPPYESTPRRRALELLQALLATHVITDAPKGEAVKTELLARAEAILNERADKLLKTSRPREATATLRVTTLIRIDFDPNQLTPDQKNWWDIWQTRAGDATEAVINRWLATGKVSSKDDFDDRIGESSRLGCSTKSFTTSAPTARPTLTASSARPSTSGPRLASTSERRGNKRLTRATGLDETGHAVDHPGYFWLAYHWRNLFPSCKACNSGAGKNNQFPVARRHVFLRALNPRQLAHCLEPPRPCAKAAGFFFLDPVTLDRLEKPLLMNPFIDDPRQHLRFGMRGIEIPLTPKGKASVEVFNLKDDGLRRLRHKAQLEANSQLFTKWILGTREGLGLEESWEQAKADTVASLRRRHVPYLAASIDWVVDVVRQPF